MPRSEILKHLRFRDAPCRVVTLRDGFGPSDYTRWVLSTDYLDAGRDMKYRSRLDLFRQTRQINRGCLGRA